MTDSASCDSTVADAHVPDYGYLPFPRLYHARCSCGWETTGTPLRVVRDAHIAHVDGERGS